MAGSVAWTVFPDSHGKLEEYCSEHSRAVLRIKKWANDMDYGDLDWYDKRDQFQWAVCPQQKRGGCKKVVQAKSQAMAAC